MPLDEGGQAEAFWWTAMVNRLFSPVQVEIIEALRVSERPLTPVELSRIFDGEVHWSVLVRHLRNLAARNIVALAEKPTLSTMMDVPYRLAWQQVSPAAGNSSR